MREGLSVVLKILLRNQASYPPVRFPHALTASGVTFSDEYLTSSLRRVNDSGLEWCGRELRQEVLLTAEVGEKAPKFTLPVGDWKNALSLAEYTKWGLVVLCYPANWSANWFSVCTDQMEEFQANLGRFEEKGAVVLAIAADSSWSHGAFAAGQGIEFPLLTDSNEQVIEDFGHQSQVVAVLEDLDKAL
jgi:peroxiredoxin